MKGNALWRSATPLTPNFCYLNTWSPIAEARLINAF
jgi:hypothetical protein